MNQLAQASVPGGQPHTDEREWVNPREQPHASETGSGAAGDMVVMETSQNEATGGAAGAASHDDLILGAEGVWSIRGCMLLLIGLFYGRKDYNSMLLCPPPKKKLLFKKKVWW